MQTFEEWVRIVANTLNLTDWTISLEWDDTLEDNYLARCIVQHARNEAKIILGKSFLELSPSEKRDTIVHELLHCHFATVDEYVSDTIPVLIGKPAYTAWESAYDLMGERAIDNVAMAISAIGAIPLPPEEGE
jgi:hypothetical protein